MKLMITLLIAAGAAFAILLAVFLNGMGRFEEEAGSASQVSLERKPRVFSGVRGHAEPTSFQPQESPASRLRPGMKRINPNGAAERRALQEQRRRERTEQDATDAESLNEEESLPPVEEAALDALPVEEAFDHEALLEGDEGEPLPLEDLPMEEVPYEEGEEVYDEGFLPEAPSVDEPALEEAPFVEGEEPVQEEEPFEEVPLPNIP